MPRGTSIGTWFCLLFHSTGTVRAPSMDGAAFQCEPEPVIAVESIQLSAAEPESQWVPAAPGVAAWPLRA